jgi:selenocysteine-specific elongation factor
MIIGTAGHIDHGKTALVKALTGVDADRLPEEKARGITLDLGYAYTPLPTGEVLGFIDVPGHEKLVRNMLAGITGIDYVLLVVAADDGPMPQTREHLQILELLGLRRGAVALTKIDMVTRERVEQARGELQTLLERTAFAGTQVFPVSSVTSAGVAPLRKLLEAEAQRLPPRPESGHFRLAIDRCFTLVGAGTVVTGTVFSGAVAVGDTLFLSPPGIKVRVRSLHTQNQPAQRGTAGQRCALNLVGEGFDKGKVDRGHWVLAAPLHAPTTRLDVQLTTLVSESDPLQHWTPVHFHLGSAEAMGRIALLEGERLAPGDAALAQVVLDRPIGALHGDRFVIRDQSALRTIGGGMVLDPFPPARGRRTPTRLHQLRSATSASAARGLELALEHSPLGVEMRRFALNWNLTDVEVAGMLQAFSAHVTGPQEARLVISQSAWSDLGRTACAAMAAEHERAPDMVGISRERLRRLAFPGLSQVAYDELIDDLLAKGRMQQSGIWLHAPDHRVELTANERALWEKIRPLLERSPFAPPRVREIAHALSIDEGVMRQLLKRTARIGEVYPVAHDHYFTLSAVTQLADLAVAIACKHGAISAAAFRDCIGTGRKLAIQILEFFDRVWFTRRAGDRHLLRQPELFSIPGRRPPPAASV